MRQHLLLVDAEDETPLYKRLLSSCVNVFNKHPKRAEATQAELLLAADVLVKSKDLLKKLKGMLDNPETPVRAQQLPLPEAVIGRVFKLTLLAAQPCHLQDSFTCTFAILFDGSHPAAWSASS